MDDERIMMRLRRKQRQWEFRVTNPDGLCQEFSTEQLEYGWEKQPRSNDGYAELLRVGRTRLWFRPLGHVEPDRSKMLQDTSVYRGR